MTTTERWELRHPDGTPADSRVIGIVGDESTVVAGVPYGTAEERGRAQLMAAAPDLYFYCQQLGTFIRLCLETGMRYPDGDYRVKIGPAAWGELQALVAKLRQQ